MLPRPGQRAGVAGLGAHAKQPLLPSRCAQAEAPGSACTVLHVVSGEEELQQQKADLLWRMLEPGALSAAQVRGSVGLVPTRGQWGELDLLCSPARGQGLGCPQPRLISSLSFRNTSCAGQ